MLGPVEADHGHVLGHAPPEVDEALQGWKPQASGGFLREEPRRASVSGRIFCVASGAE